MIAQGSGPAFEAFHHRFAPEALRFLNGRLTPEDARDVLQEALIQVWRRAQTFDASRGSAGAWFFSIIRSRCLDRLRQRRPEEGSGDQHQAGPSEEHRIVTRVLVKGLLRRLDRRRSQVLMLNYFSGMSHREIAELVRTPLGTVKSQIRSSLGELRHVLERPHLFSRARMRMVSQSAV